MNTNRNGVTENSFAKINPKVYGENYDHIFNKYKCNCHLFENQVCDICQGVDGSEKDNPEEPSENN